MFNQLPWLYLPDRITDGGNHAIRLARLLVRAWGYATLLFQLTRSCDWLLIESEANSLPANRLWQCSLAPRRENSACHALYVDSPGEENLLMKASDSFHNVRLFDT